MSDTHSSANTGFVSGHCSLVLWGLVILGWGGFTHAPARAEVGPTLPVDSFTLAASERTDTKAHAGHTHTTGPYDEADHAHGLTGGTGDHGKWMLSYRFMHKTKSGNLINRDSITPESIVTRIANPGGMPPTLRIVPETMTMTMHMFGAMVMPHHRLKFMAMIPYITKELNLVTFQGSAGTTRLGRFRTQSQGVGDPRLSSLITLYERAGHRFQLKAGFSMPVGSIDKTDIALTPANTRRKTVLPYPMQIGSGTFDLLPGLVYTGEKDRLAWGGRYDAILRLDQNARGYRRGNRHSLKTWIAFTPQDWLCLSLNVTGWTQSRIKGKDARITAPIQAAVPAFQGGRHIDLGVGADFIGTRGLLRGHRLSVNIGTPVYQNLNGPQLKDDWSLSLSLNKTF